MKEIKYLIFDWGDTIMADDPGNKQAMYLWDEIKIMPNVPESMPYLHKKYTCIVGSNAGESNAEKMRKAFIRTGLEKYFDYYFTSKELGYRKPEKEFFSGIVNALDALPENVVMVGNDYDKDIIGAKNAGLKTVLITTENISFPKADFVIKSFGELTKIL